MPDAISEPVKSFLREHISSVAQLETLLLLHMNPAHAWSAEMLAHELRVENAAAEKQLAALARGGLLILDEQRRYRYSPATPELHAAVIGLAQSYLVRRVTVIALIFASPSENIRAFSDAFRIRKDPPDAPRG